MHFFEKQKVDQIGVISVALQKVLIFLMLVNVFSLFSAGGFLSFFLCLIGLIGAMRRRTCLLMAYFTISLVFMILGLFVGLYATFYFSLYTDDYYYGSSSASSSSSFSDHFSTVPTSLARNVMRRVFSDNSANSASSSAAASAAASASASFAASASESMGSGSYFTSSWEEYSDSTAYFLTFLVLLLGFFLLYMKIFSMVLALRLRKMILATPVLPTEYRVNTEDVDNSCAMEYHDEAVEMQTQGAPIAMPAPFFNQPGYMPFTPIPMPNMQYPGNPSMVPPPMMYGQYPVYYSFAPIPPQQQQPAAPAEDSKL